jgi:hypothetical protein
VDPTAQHAVWFPPCAGGPCGDGDHVFALATEDAKLYEPWQLLLGSEWLQRAGLPAAWDWRNVIVLAIDWRGFTAGQPLAEVNNEAKYVCLAATCTPLGRSAAVQGRSRAQLRHAGAMFRNG